MKRILFNALIVSLFLLLASTAYAVSVTDVDNLGTITRNESRSATIKVANDHTESITISNITFSNAKFQVSLDAGQTPQTLAVNASYDFKATVTAPKSLDSIDSSFATKTWEETGTVKYTLASNSTQELTKTNKVKVNVDNKLEIKDWDITIESKDGNTRTYGKKTSISDIKPGDSIKIEVQVKNNFPTSGNQETDFDDVLVELALEGSNSGDFELDESDESLSLDAGDKDNAIFTIDLDDDASEGNPVLKIKASGRDENGALHGEIAIINIKVEREDHDLSFRDADMNPSTIRCGEGRAVQIDAQILNIGTRDEDDAGVELSIPGLNVFERKIIDDLNEDDDQSFTFNFNVPATAKAGVYEVKLTSVYDTTAKNNQKTLTLVVEECKKEETPQQPPVIIQQPQTNVTTQTPTVIIPTTTTQTPQVKVRETSFLDSNTYLVLLAAGATLAFLILILLLVVIFKKK